MRFLPGILALLMAVAGWYYLFYSRAAQRLSGVEDRVLNRRRVFFRRLGGLAMLLLGICFYAGFYTVQTDPPSPAFFGVWLMVFVLMALILVLALTDVQLTWKLRRNRNKRDRL